MKLHSFIRDTCLAISTACLILAFAQSGYWPILLSIPAMLLFWIVSRKQSAFWTASGLLGLYLILAVIGIVLKRPVLPLVLGCISAITWWDLTDFDQALAGGTPPAARSALEQSRLRALTMMIGVSLLAEALGLQLRLQLPFGAIALLVLLATGCILYAVYRLRNV